jgi:hypothetical protein
VALASLRFGTGADAVMIKHETIDRAEAASQFKSVDQFLSSGDSNLDATSADSPQDGTK